AGEASRRSWGTVSEAEPREIISRPHYQYNKESCRGDNPYISQVPSFNFHQQSDNNDSRGRWESARNHQQSEAAGDNSSRIQKPENSRVPSYTDEIPTINKGLPRWKRRQLQKAYKKSIAPSTT
ncbi:MAG: hypothetical protein K2J74_03385, partial [Muribaculaceae bacterium]|nr:hypothetical protein [Muribaculaceae bacterium]